MNRDYELSLTIDATNTEFASFYDSKWQSGTTFNTLISVEALDAGAGSKDAFISLSGCKVTEFSSPSPAEGVDEYSVTIKPQTTSAISKDLILFHNPDQ